jgi:hypothetical protein
MGQISNPAQQDAWEAAARKILSTLAKRYNGNLTEILADYNQGSGAGRAFKRSGDDPSSLKREGQHYIAGSQRVHVLTQNATGGSAVVQSSQLGAGMPQ